METAKDDQTTMEKSAAHRATRAIGSIFPKLTILVMVVATVEFTMVITTTPAQLHTAAITMARFTSRDLVDTQVAMAFGASVIPLTQMTPRSEGLLSTMPDLSPAAAGKRKTTCP